MTGSCQNDTVRIRAATAADAGLVMDFIVDLARYERLEHEVVGSVEALRDHLERGLFGVLIAEDAREALGFALYFDTYSTFFTAPCLHLEDLFVRESARGRGVGKALLAAVAGVAVERGCPRLQWNVLDWNEAAIAFYEKLGATVLPDWRTCRVAGGAIAELAGG